MGFLSRNYFNKGMQVKPDEMASAIRMFLESYAAAYNALENMIPKFHYIVHSVRWLRLFGFLLNTMVHERKHKVIKKFAVAVDNHNFSSSSVIREVTADHLHRMDCGEHLDLTARLLAPSAAPEIIRIRFGKYLADPNKLLVSNSARCSAWDVCSRGDIVACEGTPWHAGKVDFFLAMAMTRVCAYRR